MSVLSARAGAALSALVLAGCGNSSVTIDAAVPDGAMPATIIQDMQGCAVVPTLAITPASTTKVCQLTGETDRALGDGGVPAPNLTFTRAGLDGTDRGASFEHGGKTWFLFGDSLPTGGGNPNPSCGDAIASSASTSANQCVSLDFVLRPSGDFLSPTVPGIDLGCYNVPLAGVSSGAAAMYIWFSTNCMTRSVLAKSDDEAQTFSLIHTLSDCQCDPACTQVGPSTNCQNPSCHFINVSAATVSDDANVSLPGSGTRLLLFGSGQYRASNVYLAATSLAAIEDKTALRYYAGPLANGCGAMWTDTESDAVPLWDTVMENKNIAACVGELSVHFDAALGLWVALYNCGNRIDARVARAPWGPWSDAESVYDPAKDAGYCQFLYKPNAGCPQLSDPGRETVGAAVYAPFALGQLSTRTAKGATLYFSMSTWNPYNTMVMQSELVASP